MIAPSRADTVMRNLGSASGAASSGTPPLAPVDETSALAKQAQGQFNRTEKSKPAHSLEPYEQPVRRPVTLAKRGEPVSPSAKVPSAQSRITGEPALAQYTREHAERRLLSLWKVGHRPPKRDYCESVTGYGLRCLVSNDGLPGLIRLNRPAMMRINVTGQPAYAVATKISNESVLLEVLGRQHSINAAKLDSIWDGQFTLLWQRPDSVDRNITPGTRGSRVLWLRRTLDQIEGTVTEGLRYDSSLVARLSPDGIVGDQTLILLQNQLAKVTKPSA